MATIPDPGFEPDDSSLRDALDDAFEQHADDGPGADAPAAGPAPAAEPAPPAGDRARDNSGRFAKPAAGAAEAPPPDPATGATGEVTPPPGPADLKAPASWKPTAREKWNSLDPELQSEVVRRESELQRVMQQGAASRQFEQAFAQVVNPYEVFIRAENSTPLQAVRSLMQTAADLRMGTPAQKVAIAANIIQSYGIDLVQLDSVLAGQAPQGGQQPQSLRDPRVDQLLMQQQQWAQQQEQANTAGVQSEIQAFAAKNEFFNDVREQMGDLMEMHSRRGQALTLEQAYKTACAMNPDISKIVQTRAATAAAPSPAVLRAKRAAAGSLKDSGAPAGANTRVPANDSLRATIEAAFDQSAD